MFVFVCVQMKCEIMEHDGYEGEGLDKEEDEEDEEEDSVTEGHRPFPLQLTHIGLGQIQMNSNEGILFYEDGASDEYVQVYVCVYAVGFEV